MRICKYAYGQLKYTHRLQMQKKIQKVETYQVIDSKGNLLDNTVKYDCDYLQKILKSMIFIDEMDSILLKVKGQGKISFYMTSFGQHASIIGSAAALQAQDWVYTQYREQGAHYWRGYTIDQMINQCMGNVMDVGKGRQMPVHYGCSDYNLVTVSSPLTTQVPQAVGSGYGFRTADQDKVAAVYFGQGAASQGDFFTSLNFAATLKSQTMFLCRNNKYAISTPSTEQYISDGIIPRAISMNIASTRVDGNDAVAVFETTRKARKYIIQKKQPYFIELMTYRMGDHSTSDNSSMYRLQQQKLSWAQHDPIKRLNKFLKNVNYEYQINEIQQRKIAMKIITQSLHRCQKHKLPPINTLFDDVYDQLPRNLQEQKKQLNQHLQKYGDKYDFLDIYQK